MFSQRQLPHTLLPYSLHSSLSAERERERAVSLDLRAQTLTRANASERRTRLGPAHIRARRHAHARSWEATPGPESPGPPPPAAGAASGLPQYFLSNSRSCEEREEGETLAAHGGAIRVPELRILRGVVGWGGRWYGRAFGLQLL